MMQHSGYELHESVYMNLYVNYHIMSNNIQGVDTVGDLFSDTVASEEWQECG